VDPQAERRAQSRDFEVLKVAELLANRRDATEDDAIAAMAERVLPTTSTAQAKRDLLTLKTKASDALRVQECRDRALDALLCIAGVVSEKADWLWRRAANVPTFEDVTALRHDVTEVAQAGARAADAVGCNRATHGLLMLARAGLDEVLDDAPARPCVPFGEPATRRFPRQTDQRILRALQRGVLKVAL